MNQRFELEQQYFQAKEAYYSGDSILTDDEFDKLEQDLINMGSEAPYIVGADDRKAKYSHPSPMLSLGKYQAAADGTPPTDSANKWMANTGAKVFEATPKFDGNAANVIYSDGKLVQILTRGNGTKGRDITDKVKHNVPTSIIQKGIVEIRGEVCIKISTFNRKYAKEFKNPRNFVAGVLNRDDNSPETISELDFIPIEVRRQFDGDIEYLEPSYINGLKFIPYSISINISDINSFDLGYANMKTFREQISDYPLDGFVIKTPLEFRYKLGENSHDPNWAIAIKFPPKEAITKIIDISWQWGKTGRVTPVAIMESVDLDGSMVSRASLFNIGFIKESGAMIGATVAIAKAGDIIPQILRVIQPAENTLLDYPKQCKCGNHLDIQGVHLLCNNIDCSTKAKYKFCSGVYFLEIDGVGGAIANLLWDAGFRSALELLDPTKMNKKSLIATGKFKDGKTIDNILKEIQKIKEIHPMGILMLMGIDNMGHTVAKQIGNYLVGVPHTFHGLQKDVISGFEPGGYKRLKYEELVNQISPYVKLIMPEIISNDSIPFEMSGSPKAFGFKTKEEFVKVAKLKGYHHASLSSAKVLFVEDVNNLSGKIKAAQNKGVKILPYSDIL